MGFRVPVVPTLIARTFADVNRWISQATSVLNDVLRVGTTRIQTYDVPVPTSSNDGQSLGWDQSTQRFTYLTPFTLDPSGVTPGTYGDGTHVGQFTVNADGLLTFAQNVAITFPGTTGATGGPTGSSTIVPIITYVDGLLTAVSSTTITGTVPSGTRSDQCLIWNGSAWDIEQWPTPCDLVPSSAGVFDDEFNASPPTFSNSFPAYPGGGQTIAQNFVCTNAGNAYTAAVAGMTTGTAPTGTGLTVDGGVTWAYFASSANACQIDGWTCNGIGALTTSTDMTTVQSANHFSLDYASRPGWWRVQPAVSLTLRFGMFGPIATDGWLGLQFRVSANTTTRVLLGLKDDSGANFEIMDMNNSIAGQVRWLKNGLTSTGPTYSPAQAVAPDRFWIEKRGSAYNFYVGTSEGIAFIGAHTNAATMTQVFFGVDQPVGATAYPGNPVVDFGFIRSTSSGAAP